MNIPEIRSEDWPEFCNRFTEFNRGTLLTIEVIGSDGIPTEIAREMPLDKMSFDTTDACNDVINIHLGTNPDQRKFQHAVIDPLHIRLRPMEAGRKALEIASENGTNLVSFHSGRFPQMNVNGASRERRVSLPSLMPS